MKNFRFDALLAIIALHLLICWTWFQVLAPELFLPESLRHNLLFISIALPALYLYSAARSIGSRHNAILFGLLHIPIIIAIAVKMASTLS